MTVRFWMIVCCLIVWGALLWGIGIGFGQTAPQALISWRANTESDLAGYRVYQAVAPGSYATGPAALLQPTSTSVTIHLPQQRCTVRYYFTVTAFDWGGKESVKSVEVSKSITGTQYWIGACKK